MIQIIIESFNSLVSYRDWLVLQHWLVLALYDPGDTTGVVESGNMVHTYSVLPHTALCLDPAGRYLTICFIEIRAVASFKS